MTARVRPGAVVSWWNGDALAFGLVRGEEKQRICLVTERGKEERVKAARVAVEVGSPGTVLGRSAEERQRAAERIRSVEARVRARAERIDVRLSIGAPQDQVIAREPVVPPKNLIRIGALRFPRWPPSASII